MEVPTINISLETLIKECSLGKKSSSELFQDFCMMNRENIHEIFKYKKFHDDFTDYLTCYTEGNQVIGMIRPSYDEFRRKLIFFLNANVSHIKTEEDLTVVLNERLAILKGITTEENLKREFLQIYEDLIQGRRYMREIQKREKEDPSSVEEERHYFYACALKQRLDRFIDTQGTLYQRFIDNRESYKNLISKKSYNQYIRENFDIDKIALYVVHCYLSECEKSSDPQVIKKYFDHVLNYLDTDYDKSVSLKIDSKEEIHFQNIQNRIENIKRKLNDNEGLVEWIIIPDGKDYDRVKKGEGNHRNTVLNWKEMEELRKRGERKNRFYEGTNYLVKVAGLYKYRGYIAYIYPNGEVLLDREYDDNKPKSDQGNAIYHMHSVDFEALSKLDKSVLRNHPRVQRIIHSKNWETKARSIIEQDAPEEEIENVKQLVKRLKEKK